MDQLVENLRGHNHPPELTVSERLAEAYESLFAKVESLALRANEGPRVVKTPEHLNAVGILITEARALAKEADNSRVAEKQPFLTGGKAVDGFFKTATDRLDKIKTVFENAATIYQREVAAQAWLAAEKEARKAREEEAARQELARKAEEANRGHHADQHQQKAEAAARRAESAEVITLSSAADLTRTRTESGVLATAKTEWAFEITDGDAIQFDKLRAYIKRDAVESAIRLAIKMGVRDLAGVRIFEDVRASFR